MNCKFLKILKVASLCATFLFNAQAFAEETTLESIKLKATELLLLKKKNQALQLLTNYIKNDVGHNNKDEAIEFSVKIAQKFISREAQEAYENSLNLTLDDPKAAMKSNDKCLLIEPQQLECLIQKMRLFLRDKNNFKTGETAAQIKEIVPRSKYEYWLELILIKDQIEFKNKQIIKNIPEKNTEINMGLILLELDRCFLAKNYSRAKDLISHIEKNYSDWPDLLFYKYKINLESNEEKQKIGAELNSEPLAVYFKKCISLNKTVARKFRYDFLLCARGAK